MALQNVLGAVRVVCPDANELRRWDKDLFRSTRFLKYAAEFEKAVVDEEIGIGRQYLDRGVATSVGAELWLVVEYPDDGRGGFRK